MRKVATLEKCSFDSYDELRENKNEFVFYLERPYSGTEELICIVDNTYIEENEYSPEGKSELGLYVEEDDGNFFVIHPIENYDLDDIYGLKEV